MEKVFCEITASKINESVVFQKVSCAEHGGMNFFFGAVRKVNAGKNVVAVAYDVFEPLAMQTFRQIAEEARKKWGEDLRVCMVHRTGHLVPGEVSVGVGVSSRHRDESYQASRYIIEQIKHRAPIWKKEIYRNGETEWLKGHALCQRTGAHAEQPLEHHEHCQH